MILKYINIFIISIFVSLIFTGCVSKFKTLAKDGNIDTIHNELKSIEDKQELLAWSAYYGKFDKVKYLLENGADINYNKGGTYDLPPAIIMATAGNNLDMVKYLVKNGADVNKQTGYGRNAVLAAALQGRLNIVQYLAEQGAELYVADNLFGKNTITQLQESGYGYFIPVILNIQKERKAKLEKQQLPLKTQIASSEDKNSGLDDISSLLKKSEIQKIDNTKWLFIIAIENYEYTSPVVYSANSASQFKTVMQKRLGISEKNTRTLINQGATSAKIDYNLKDMLRRVKEGDTIYFYYSGHGIPVASQNNAPYMLAQDMNPAYITDERFKLQNIYKSLSDSKAAKVVAFMDSCFSGGTDNEHLIKGVAAARMVPKKVTFDKSKMIVISAGSGTQYSNKYDDKANRLFSYYLMRGLIKNNNDVQRLYDYIKSNVQDKSYEMGASYEQVPVYDGNIGLEF
ncbi:putative cysteine-peptidase containing Ankyrin r epeat domain [Sulfurimonas gotlandica GD1]|jgi:ankyrin repeat protein|uniref:Putative cysteine-peptidase containing Ankyrin r epeat domain n=1 Tax=Sulfurimonas gotlandica (strain DSM 19862 / JCM 16533 / GD1) TaxID=929558 RepID=B6BHQ4_SULGG|nr:ankyrin repeat domain-containing protein [Sulfurimonas gotlandica]EDZ63699.1 caspase domain protein [Sulfurimonas gotlandica GD1]EHP30053.1 putative cysteine-peptidase containing Ankyrin r epeat domain [Sulfurimonas gotlandica GD1]